jgi:hypothetical protein
MKKVQRSLAALVAVSFFIFSIPSNVFAQPPGTNNASVVPASPPKVHMSTEQKAPEKKKSKTLLWAIVGIALVGTAAAVALGGGSSGGDGGGPKANPGTGDLTVGWK